MKAAIVSKIGAIDDVVVDDMPPPSPADGEVVVRVAAAEVNFPDVLVVEGRYQVRPPLPFVPGTAAAGTVHALGRDVRGLGIGQRVLAYVGHGAFAQYVPAPATACFAIPDGIELITAAAAGLAAQTAHFALFERGGLKAGESVLVLGGGGAVGRSAIQQARAAGAGVIVGAARGAASASAMVAAGADAAVDLDQPDIHEVLKAEVLVRTNGHGADVVIDPLGGTPHAAAIRAMAWCGRLVVVGFAAGDIPTVRANYLLVKNITVHGLQWTDYRDRQPARVAAAHAEIMEWCRTGRFQPRIAEILPLERTAEALRHVARGGSGGRIILAIA